MELNRMTSVLPAVFAVLFVCSAFAEDRANILYIALEDITPMMGCYGDDYAKLQFSTNSPPRGFVIPMRTPSPRSA